MALVGLHLRAGKEAAQPCPSSRWKKWLTRQVWLPTWQIFVFDTVKGYKSFDTLQGFFQTLLAECLESESQALIRYSTDSIFYWAIQEALNIKTEIKPKKAMIVVYVIECLSNV